MADSLHTTGENTLQDITATLNSLAKLGQRDSSNVTPPTMIFGATPTAHGSTGFGSSVAETIPEEAAPIAVNPSISTPPATPSAPDVVLPVSNVITAVAGSVASAPALLVSLPTSASPVSDVLDSLQNMLTSVADASAPLAQLPSDLSALLGVGTVIPEPVAGAGSDRVEPSAIAGGPTQAPGAPLPLLPGFVAVLAAGQLSPPAAPLSITTAGTSSGVARSASLLAPGDESSVLSTVQHVIGIVVATVSLTALAAVALPGIAGLLGSCAAGIRIGYRQAKGGSALHATAIARFVDSGPIGVVRSGSQVSLRPRIGRSSSRGAVARDAGPRGLSSVHLLDRAS